MIIHVRLYASLRRYGPVVAIGQAFDCSTPGGASVGHLLHELLGLPAAEVAIMLVNGLRCDPAHPLSDGDQVSVWPPIAGG